MNKSLKFSILLINLLAVVTNLHAQKARINEIDWSVGASLPGSWRGQQGVLAGVHENVLIVAGGKRMSPSSDSSRIKYSYNDTGYAMMKDNSGGIPAAPLRFLLPKPLAFSATCASPMGVVAAGGESTEGILRDVFLLQWQSATRTVLVKALPPLPYALKNAAIANQGTMIYLAGGETTTGITDLCMALDLGRLTDGWQKMPALPEPLSSALAVVQSNGDHPALYISGGNKDSAAGANTWSASVYEYDLKTFQWRKKAPMPTGLSYSSALAAGASYMLAFGHNDSRTLAHNNTSVKEGGSEILLYNTVTDAWTISGTLPFTPDVVVPALRWDEDILIAASTEANGAYGVQMMKGSISKKQFFSWLDITVLVICFLLMTIARHFFTSHKTTAADYFKGGQKIPQWAAGISIFGAKLSAITFMGVPAKAYATDWTYIFLLMTIIMIMPVVLNFFIPFYRRLNVTSAYEYLDKRFNYGSRVFASLLYILLQVGRMGIVVLLPSIALTLVTGINVNLCILLIGAISIFFTVRGGIEAVIWVEVVQVLILAGGALLCLFYIPFQLHDIGSIVSDIRTYDKLKIFDLRLDFTEPTLWVVIIGGLALNLVTYGTDQTTVQRYLTTKTEKEARRSLKVGAWLALPSSIVFFSIGTLLFLFFRQQPDQVNFSLNNMDNIFPWYIVSQLPAGLSGLLIAGIFAAAMSSTEASMNSVATLLTTDFYKKIKPDVSEKQTLTFARITTLLLGLFVTALALYMAQKGIISLWDKFNTILGLFTGCIGGVFLLGIFTRKANGKGAVMGMFASCITQIWVQGNTSIHLLMYAFTGVVSCVFFGYLFSMFVKSEKDISGLTVFDLKKRTDNL